MGNTFGPKGFCKWFEPACLIVEVAQIMIHEADEPNPVVGLFDADCLAGKDLTEIHHQPILHSAPFCSGSDCRCARAMGSSNRVHMNERPMKRFLQLIALVLLLPNSASAASDQKSEN